MKHRREIAAGSRQSSDSFAEHLKTCNACWGGRLCETGRKLKRDK
jgi:hypothetical protein